MSRVYPIADLAMAKLGARLAANGSEASESASCSLHSLTRTFEKALRGELADRFYLASLDPGQGKSLSLALFLNSWAERGYSPDEGALVGVSRKSEIETLVSQSGLPKSEFGVLTAAGNEELNALGLPKERHGSARVLFTTQQMIARRCAGQRFDQTTAFHFRGKPRKLRIWDEALTPMEGFSVGRDALGSLLSLLRLDRPDYHAALGELMDRLEAVEHGDRLLVPRIFDTPPKTADWLKDPTDEQLKMVENLRRLSGHEALVISDSGLGNALVGVTQSLPRDLTPLIVLDASGRVRPTYPIQQRWLRNLERLPAGVSDYSNLRIHSWPQASGRRKLRDPKGRQPIVAALAEAINRDSATEWLVVAYKEATNFRSELLAHVAGDPSRVRFIHWGNHHGTNEFRDVPNVALVGQLAYRESGNVAVALGAGLPERQASDLGRDFKEAEWAHHTLQAALRGAARKVVDGKASPMELFMVLSPSPCRVSALKRIFPGAAVTEWEPWPKELTGQALQLAQHLSDQFTAGASKVRKKDAREAVGIRHSSNLSGNILKQPAFVRFMEERGIEDHGQWFVLVDAP